MHSGIVFTTSSKLSIVDCGAVHYREKLLVVAHVRYCSVDEVFVCTFEML